VMSLTSPTSGARSVGIVRLRTKTTEFAFVCFDASGGGTEGAEVANEFYDKARLVA
jgi:hypothetical protein